MVKISGLNANEVKMSNRSKILQILHLEACSRIELSRRMGLTRASISIIINQLIEEGILREGAQQAARGGRPSVAIEINPDAAYALGISLKRDCLRMGMMNLKGQIFGYRELWIEAIPRDTDEAMEVMEECIGKIMEDTPMPGEFLGIGIAAPGPLDSEEGKILNPPNFGRFQNVPIVEQLKNKFECQVLLENDIIALALAENVYGIRGKHDSFLEVCADCGLGSGLIFQGQRFRDMNGFGHISIDIHGPLCQCGNRGCVELYAAVENIVDRAKKENIQLDSWNKIVDMAALKEQTACGILEEEAQYLAEAIVSAANVIGFDAVVLSGSLTYRFEYLAEKMKDMISKRVFKKRDIEILASALPEKANVLAGAELLVSKWLKK